MAAEASKQRSINVFVRWRPLAASETEPCQISAKKSANNSNKNTNTDSPSLVSVSINRQATAADKEWTSAPTFDGVLEPSSDNLSAYQLVVADAIPNTILQGGSFSVFAYGHSGSGKTHTIIGYDNDNHDINPQQQLGICLAAARDLFAALEHLNSQLAACNSNDSDSKDTLAIGLSIFELRDKKAFDLLNPNPDHSGPNATPCHIRQGPDGKTHIRGETQLLPDGKVRVCPILQLPCFTFPSFRNSLLNAIRRRAVGSSTVHADLSSRTHAVVELEVVSRRLVDAQGELYDRQSDLVPVGKRATDVAIEEQSRGFIRDDKGEWVPNPEYQVDQARIDKAEKEKAVFEKRVAEAEAEIDKVLREGRAKAASRCLGGKMVFVDLAGAEYHRENRPGWQALQPPEQTAQEKQQGRQINTDLLALKEVIRAWSGGKARIPFRSSALTMVLREHFQGASDEGGGGAANRRSAMIVTVSPAREQYAATLNSLKYGSLVGTV